MNATWLDRSLGWFFPEVGRRRLAARQAMAVLSSYDAGRTGARTEGWRPSLGTSADAAGELEWSRIRDRARDLTRNNAIARRAVDVKVRHTIGTGITAEVPSGRVRSLWEQFLEECDLDRVHDLHGMLGLSEACRFEAGECLIRFYEPGPLEVSDLENGSPIPLKMRILEPDYLDTSRDTYGGRVRGDIAEGHEIKYGIEYDSFGRPVAYYLFPQHPGDRGSIARVGARGFDSERVPAEDVIHVFRRQRPGQSRGISDFAPVVMRLRDLDDFADAHIVAKKTAACLVGVLTTPEDLSASALGVQEEQGDLTKERLHPATFYRARLGESITFSAPPPMHDYEQFMKITQREIASGLNIPYELLSNDRADVNYTSMRGGLIDFRKTVLGDQWLLYIPRVCRAIEKRFRLALERRTPGLGARTGAFEWTPPKFELMDPLKETQADLESVLAAFEPLEEIQRQRGWSQDDIFESFERTFKELDKRGLGSIFRSDPRTEISLKKAESPPNTGGSESDGISESAGQ